MIFVARYRNADGAVAAIDIEAASRTEAFSALKARGIVPLSLKEGGGGRAEARPSLRKAGGKSRSSGGNDALPRGWVAVSVVLAVIAATAVGAWLWMSPGNVGGKSKDGGKKSSRQSAYVEVPVHSKAKGPTAQPTPSKAKTRPIGEATKANVPIHADAVAVSNYVATHYTTNSAVRPLDPNDPDLPIMTGINQELGSLMSTELGDPVPPFPYSFHVEGDINDQNDEFVKSLKHDVKLRDTDSLTRAEGKQKLLQARLDLLDAMDQGMTVKDAIKAAYVQRVRAYEARTAYIEDLKAYAAENPEKKDFEDTLRVVNDKLGEKGIKAIDMDSLGLEVEEEESKE